MCSSLFGYEKQSPGSQNLHEKQNSRGAVYEWTARWLSKKRERICAYFNYDFTWAWASTYTTHVEGLRNPDRFSEEHGLRDGKWLSVTGRWIMIFFVGV